MPPNRLRVPRTSVVPARSGLTCQKYQPEASADYLLRENLAVAAGVYNRETSTIALNIRAEMRGAS